MRSLIVAALTWLGGHGLHLGKGTIFDAPERDRHNPPGRMACESRLSAASQQARVLFRRGHLIAHRTLPCWSVVEICSLDSGACTLATVADRGPRKAAADLWAVLARALGHRGGWIFFHVAAPQQGGNS